jgi:hypothetical protein
MNEIDFASSFISMKVIDAETKTIVVPVLMGSGFMMSYRNKKFFLTVLHNLKESRALYLEMKMAENKAGMNGRVLSLEHFGRFVTYKFDKHLPNNDFEFQDLLNNGKMPDFGFIEIPNEEKFYGYRLENNQRIEYEKTIHNINFDIKPKQGEKYCFAGLKEAEPADINSSNEIHETLTIEEELIFEGEVEKDNHSHYYFHANFDKSYPGCSGSPIMDQEGRVVSILVGGSEKTKKILGVNLASLKGIIDASIDA